MFHYHNNILAVEAAFLYNKKMLDRISELEEKGNKYLAAGNQEQFMIVMTDLQWLKHEYNKSEDTFISKFKYENLLKSKKLKKLTTGGNGRQALIDWSSLDESLKQQIIKRVGFDPTTETKNKTFADTIGFDEKADKFFKEYQKSNGETLSTKQIAQYIERVNIFNAIQALIAERESKRSAFGKSVTVLWQNIAKTVSKLPTYDIHRLPKNHLRLQEAYNKYLNDSYAGVLHKGLENDNTSKIKGDIADWWLAMYSLPTKMVVPIIMNSYDHVRIDKGWPTLTVQGVHKWLQKPENERKWTLGRHGREEWNRKYANSIKRNRDNWFANSYWAIDGSKIDWLHYEDNQLGMAARLKINPTIDVYSEKIIGWSFSESETHVDHFNSLKMAISNAGARPYLLTYDNQSGHKSGKMQELYTKIVAKNGGLHYPHKANKHNSPAELVFKRLQQQVINQLWFSDKQSPTVRTMDNKPNLEFIKEYKHKLQSKEALIKAWEVCVALWNDAKHPKYKDMTRNEVFAMEAPMREDVGLLDMVELFWVYNSKAIKYRGDGLRLTVAGRDYHYEVLNDMSRIDIEFRRKYVGASFIVKYDPDHLNDFVQLYIEDAKGNRSFVANAQPKRTHETIPVLMQEGDKAQWKEDYDTTEIEYQRDLKAIEALRARTGITPEKLIEDQEIMLKMGGILPKKIRTKAESEPAYLSTNDRI